MPKAGLFSVVLLAGGCAATPSQGRSDEPAEARTESPVVSTAIADSAPAPAPPSGLTSPPSAEPARIGALGPHTWIWKKPDRTGLAIGKLRIGTSVQLRSPDPVDGPGCKGRWYAIEPRGYVCRDNTATLDLNDPYYKALELSAPRPGVWPYRYAHSNGTPMYSRVPKPEEWLAAERDYGPPLVFKTLGQWARGHEEQINDTPIRATDEVPYFLRDGARTAPGGNYDTRALVWRRMPPGSMLAYSHAFEMYGRVWLLTPDTMVVPADRLSDMTRSSFHGVHFSESDMRLPFAWNRSKAPIAIYARSSDGTFERTADTLAPKTPIEISDGEHEHGGWVYYELRKQPGRFVGKTLDANKQLDVELSVTRQATELPRAVQPGEKWIEVKIGRGTLTAYEGLEPVLATLFSPGKGGPPEPDFQFPRDHNKYATTAIGRFPLEWKERVATMSNEHGEPKVLWFTDVPYQQYLKAPLALHVAFWHADFGIRKSAECVNVSPIDGVFLFGWTLPVLPPGWNAVGAGQGNGPSTPVVVSVN